MLRIILTLIVCFTGVSVVNAKASFCEKMVAKYINCGASSKFIDAYSNVCRNGDLLGDADLIAINKMFDQEMSSNLCLSKVFREPRVDRATRNKIRKENREFMRQIEQEKREERDKAKSASDPK